jgi:manganese-dependent inorganic pyrophosphatase
VHISRLLLKKNKMIVTSYLNPDIDGVSCSIAYSEFLKKKGFQAKACICGSPNKEAMFVLNRFKVKSEDCSDFLNEKVIVVDTSKPEDLCPKINAKDVIEVIDHRRYTNLSAFPNAKSQIELVGACATLIAEKYKTEGIEIKIEHAGLLYSAIVSNTINFKANVTTKRDIDMAKWLNARLHLTEKYTREMFENKSHLKGNIKEIFESDFSRYDNSGLGIAQLEIMGAEKFVNNNFNEIKNSLSEIKNEKKLKFIFLTVIDVMEGFNIFVCIDEESEKLLEKTLKVSFKEDVAKREGIIMRKEIVPLIKEKFNC